MSDSELYKPSRFNFKTRNSNGELVLYNSFTGAVGLVAPEHEELVEAALKPAARIDSLHGVLNDLNEAGMLVPAAEDEFAKAAEFHHDVFHQEERLHLIIMPTEECNFRCVYCYEDFKVKEMPKAVRSGIKNLVAARAPKLTHLNISWFGGEPTEAPDVILELSRHFLALCEQYGIVYETSMTTNGYNLQPDFVKTLIEECKIDYFNITLDGVKEDHDQRRIKKGGGETFETIISNLRRMKETDYQFHCQLRTNFDKHSREEVPKLMHYLLAEFEGDPRFPVYYRTIGKWGGPNDDQLDVCDGSQGLKEMFALHKQARELGLPLAVLDENIGPSSSVCYAALPHSFVVGADGTIYKCTVALDKEYNKVGQLDEHGNLNLNEERFNLWISSNETIDTGCQRCFYRPSCQGAACPYERIEEGIQPCPPSKTQLKHVLDVMTT